MCRCRRRDVKLELLVPFPDHRCIIYMAHYILADLVYAVVCGFFVVSKRQFFKSRLSFCGSGHVCMAYRCDSQQGELHRWGSWGCDRRGGRICGSCSVIILSANFVFHIWYEERSRNVPNNVMMKNIQFNRVPPLLLPHLLYVSLHSATCRLAFGDPWHSSVCILFLISPQSCLFSTFHRRRLLSYHYTAPPTIDPSLDLAFPGKATMFLHA